MLGAGPAQMLSLKAILIPAPPMQLKVVVVATNLRTPAQYDGLMAMVPADKGKQRTVPTIDDESDYGELPLEEEEEEGKAPAQPFQRIQHDKKLAQKRANRAKNAAALVHRAQNDFSGRIPNRLGVKIWGLLDVEQLNLCFCGLGPCVYYSYLLNTMFVGANMNRVSAYEFGSGQVAKIPGTMVYKYAGQGFSSTPFELEQLHKYYANIHLPRCDRIVAYMLLTELQEFVQQCDVSLHDLTMKLLCTDLHYQDLINPIQGPEDLSMAKQQHIPLCYMHIKDDGTVALHVMRAPNPNKPFDLKQIAQYALIFGCPGMENMWQCIAWTLLS
ncbi:hypothetical protein C0992_008626 [Termitomyces sp. T32_za158]|nr:hypothetical protein C0992_008626 [Termitomyces sp. T32_za158]